MKRLQKICSFFFCVLSLFLYGTLFVSAEGLPTHKDTPVIVIDPGHGGENLGTTENCYEEKSITLITAKAMYEELSKFDGITVYLTRDSDVDVSIKNRAVFAESVGADFLFSIHYNASENHELFGSEVWVSSVAPYNNYGTAFAKQLLPLFKEDGLFIRGIKTRLNDKGTDYYGIIRECVAREIPSVIIEHCHVDESRDTVFCDTQEKLVSFGKEDAHAVAKCFGLKSTILNLDYSDTSLDFGDLKTPVQSTLKDYTEPELCEVLITETDYSNGLLKATVRAKDSQSCLLYYDYSIDGGATFSKRYKWPTSDALLNTYDENFSLTLTIPDGSHPALVVRAYNLYDSSRESNTVVTEKAYVYAKEREEEAVIGESSSVPEEETSPTASNSVLSMLDLKLLGKIIPVAAFIILALYFIAVVVIKRKDRREEDKSRHS